MPNWEKPYPESTSESINHLFLSIHWDRLSQKTFSNESYILPYSNNYIKVRNTHTLSCRDQVKSWVNVYCWHRHSYIKSQCLPQGSQRWKHFILIWVRMLTMYIDNVHNSFTHSQCLQPQKCSPAETTHAEISYACLLGSAGCRLPCLLIYLDAITFPPCSTVYKKLSFLGTAAFLLKAQTNQSPWSTCLTVSALFHSHSNQSNVWSHAAQSYE